MPITFDCAVTDIARLAADVVVGADGHDSAVRRAVLGDGPAARNGWVTWQGLDDNIKDLGTHARCFVGPQGLCGLMPAGSRRCLGGDRALKARPNIDAARPGKLNQADSGMPVVKYASEHG